MSCCSNITGEEPYINSIGRVIFELSFEVYFLLFCLAFILASSIRFLAFLSTRLWSLTYLTLLRDRNSGEEYFTDKWSQDDGSSSDELASIYILEVLPALFGLVSRWIILFLFLFFCYLLYVCVFDFIDIEQVFRSHGCREKSMVIYSITYILSPNSSRLCCLFLPHLCESLLSGFSNQNKPETRAMWWDGCFRQVPCKRNVNIPTDRNVALRAATKRSVWDESGLGF